MIEYDVNVVPVGTLGWTRLLEAVENAHPSDESEWIEFKANLDPNSNEGRTAVAKAIVAFANRDPQRAQTWCGGYAFIVVGLEPGSLVGASRIDPADLHNKVNALLADPAPTWDMTPVPYKGKDVIVITVYPPQPGDPIACIGKSSGKVEDGNVFVRVLGKSERAKSADIRRLSTRLGPGGETLRDITVTSTGIIASVDYDSDWMARWIEDEETDLLAPLMPEPEPDPEPKSTYLNLSRVYPGLDAAMSVAANLRSQAERYGDLFVTKHEEDRTEEEYRAEAESYLDRCTENLPNAFEKIRASAATPVTFLVTNNTERNYKALLVKLHVEGDVFGYDWVSEFDGWTKYVGKRPRLWGPWTESKMSALGQFNNYAQLRIPPYQPQSPVAPAPRPRIENGGSVNIICVPVDLRPGETESLLTLNLVADRTVASDVRVTWTATATDVGGKLSDEFTIPVAGERTRLDLYAAEMTASGDVGLSGTLCF